jgi:hypothetical protein
MADFWEAGLRLFPNFSSYESINDSPRFGASCGIVFCFNGFWGVLVSMSRFGDGMFDIDGSGPGPVATDGNRRGEHGGDSR